MQKMGKFIIICIQNLMPNTTSAKKALRQNATRKAQNNSRKAAYKKVLKEVRKGVSEKLPALYKALDKAAKTGVIKKNKASRLKSRVAAQLKAKSSKASS